MDLSRRRFIRTAAGAGVAAAAAATPIARAATASTSHAAVARTLPDPRSSGIEHIVVVCMENRSFDHYLGWVPGANGRQAGLVYSDAQGRPHATHHLQDWQGCGHTDPDHSYRGGRIQLNKGRCDGFRLGRNDDFALGYYTKGDLPTNDALVSGFTIFDGWFAGILSSTYPNRMYTHAAATDRLTNSFDVSSLPTIWDRFASAGVPAAYYFSDLPFLGLWGTKYARVARPGAQFAIDAAAGLLPAFSYVEPFFLGNGQGGANDDHPHADVRRGQAFLSGIVRAVTTSPLWEKTVLLITYDEWGGFFDHVAPPRLPDAFRPTATEEHNTAGFRVPTYLVSPFAPRGKVAHGRFDHSSILKLAEWRWGLKPLTVRDAAAANPAVFLDFAKAPNRRPPAVPSVPDPGPHLCGAPEVGMLDHEPFWEGLAALPALRAFEWR